MITISFTMNLITGFYSQVVLLWSNHYMTIIKFSLIFFVGFQDKGPFNGIKRIF